MRAVRRLTAEVTIEVVAQGIIRVAPAAATGVLFVGGLAAAALTDWTGIVIGVLGAAVIGLAAVALRLMVTRPAPRLPQDPSPVRREPGPVPHIEGFVGRDREVAEIMAALSIHPAVCVVGRRGVGSSACAWEAVRRKTAAMAGEAGGWQPVYVDARRDGRSSARRVATDLARELGVADRLAGVVGVAGSADLGDALRDVLLQRRLLVVVDNVDDVAQVHPLVRLPGDSRLLVVGSLDRGALASAKEVEIREPVLEEAVELLASTAGLRPLAPDGGPSPALPELADLCGRQPGPIAALGRGIAGGALDTAGALEALRRAVGAPPHELVPYLPAPATLAAEDVAYAALRPRSQRLFRRLGLIPERRSRDDLLDERTFMEGQLTLAPLPLDAIAVLAGRRFGGVADLVGELTRGGFITSVAGGGGDRYRLRPLLAPYARLHLRRDERTWRRMRALARLTRHLAREATRHGGKRAEEHRQWFAANHELLAAVVASATSRAGRQAAALPRGVRYWWFTLAEALCAWYANEDRLDDWQATCDVVLGATKAWPRLPLAGRFANQLGTWWRRPRVAGWVHNEQGVILRRRGEVKEAITEFDAALLERGHRGKAQALTNRGLARLDFHLDPRLTPHPARDRTALEAAKADLTQALRHRSPRDHVGRGLTELGLGVAFLHEKAGADACYHLIRAVDAFDLAGDLRGAATAYTNLILGECMTGAHGRADEAARMAGKLYEQHAASGRRDTRGEAAVPANLRACPEDHHASG